MKPDRDQNSSLLEEPNRRVFGAVENKPVAEDLTGLSSEALSQELEKRKEADLKKQNETKEKIPDAVSLTTANSTAPKTGEAPALAAAQSTKAADDRAIAKKRQEILEGMLNDPYTEVESLMNQ